MLLMLVLLGLFLGVALFVVVVLGPNAALFIGPNRQRSSTIQSWPKTDVVNTRLGRIVGLYQKSANGVVHAFLGIRYAQPPIGDLRFMPPRAASPWTGVFQATRFPKSPIQSGQGRMASEPNSDERSEDCLFLSVYTPSTEGNHRPVMVWIHGGAFVVGSGNGYVGTVLAAGGDVVVVTINYRLGLLGFCDLSMCGEQYRGSASNGIRDQVLALEWVNQNIADYGGDADNITVFGESAGGSSVFSLLSTPSAEGLFHKAIIHSGIHVATPPHDYSEALMKHLRIQDRSRLADALQSLDAKTILRIQNKIGFFAGGNIDGVVVTQHTRDALKKCASRGIPIIVGTNKDEGSLFTLISPRITYTATLATVADILTEKTAAQSYLRTMKDAFPGLGLSSLLAELWTDMFRRSALCAVEWAAAQSGNVWLYRFDEPVQVGPRFHELGATHAAEIEFTFNNFARTDLSDRGLWYRRNDPAIRELADAWSSLVTRFAATGKVGDSALPEWPSYNQNDKSCLILKRDAQIEQNPEKERLRRWSEIGLKTS